MTEPTGAAARRAALETHLRWVPLDTMRIAEEGKGQRELRNRRVDHIISVGFNLELMGHPVVSARDGHHWILDGAARIGALKVWLKDWKGQQVQCRVFIGLTVEQEAEIFLELNDFTQVSAFAKFKNAVTAGRPVESDIDRIVRASNLLVSREHLDNNVSCVSTLIRVYKRGDPSIFARSLRVVRDTYGKPGLEATVIDGLGLLCQRYNGELAEADAVTKLSGVRGGVNGLLGRAQTIRKTTGAALNESVAAAAVDIINAGKGGKKLKPWFKAAVQS